MDPHHDIYGVSGDVALMNGAYSTPYTTMFKKDFSPALQELCGRTPLAGCIRLCDFPDGSPYQRILSDTKSRLPDEILQHHIDFLCMHELLPGGSKRWWRALKASELIAEKRELTVGDLTHMHFLVD